MSTTTMDNHTVNGHVANANGNGHAHSNGTAPDPATIATAGGIDVPRFAWNGKGKEAYHVGAWTLEAGLWPVVIYPRGAVIKRRSENTTAEGKEPIGERWGADRLTLDKLKKRRERNPGAGAGICLGPGRAPGGLWLADFEIDGAGGEESFIALCGGELVLSLGWGSTRGPHLLLLVDGDRLLSLLARAGAEESKDKQKPGVWHLPLLPGLEMRIGGHKPNREVKQLQSVIPPTEGTDGMPRTFNNVWTIAWLPEAAYGFLEEIAASREAERSSPPTIASARSRERPDRRTSRLDAYLEGTIAKTADRVSALGPGERHDGLRSESIILAGFAKGAGEPWISRAREALLLANRANGHAAKDPGDGEELIRSAFEMATPKDLSHLNEEGHPSRPGSGVNGKADHQWPATPPGKCVQCIDRTPPNYGEIVQDLGDRARVHFESPSGHENTVTLHKQFLREQDGSPLGQGDDSEATKTTALASLSDADLGIRRASEIEARPIEWLWRYRLAAGEMALLAGDGGMGKSSLLLAIAAKLSRGEDWWDGGQAPLGDTIIVSAEDDPATTIVPRLRAMDADLDRITILSATVTIKKPGKDPEIHPKSLQDRPYWQEVFRRHPEARLLIVDPLPSYLGNGVSDSKNNELRGILEPFLDLVTRPAGVCLLANTHLNKSIDAKTPTHRITGSIAYVNLPRNVHVVVADPERNERRFLKQCKCNNAPGDLPALAFTVEKQILASDHGEIETAIPRFEAETVSVDLGHLMGGGGHKSRGPKPAKTEKLAIWLFDHLSQEQHPVQAGPLYDAAGAAFASEVPNPLGEKGHDGKWTSGRNLLRAADHVPNLPAPRDGKRVNRFQDPDNHRWYWRLINVDSPY